MFAAGQSGPGGALIAVRANALSLPFPDGCFDVVIASEVLEHIPEDLVAMREIARVLRPGGMVAVTVPRRFPERLCWILSDSYHETAGGHVRIYRGDVLIARMRSSGLAPQAKHHAHALHSPYWWLKCALGVAREDARLPQIYHRFLVWELMRRPHWTRQLERVLNPILGKSLVVYAQRPVEETRRAAA